MDTLENYTLSPDLSQDCSFLIWNHSPMIWLNFNRLASISPPPPISFKHTYTLTLFGFKGRNCERCQSLFYREVGTLLWAKDVCKPCECHSAGTANGSLECEPVSVDIHTQTHYSYFIYKNCHTSSKKACTESRYWTPIIYQIYTSLVAYLYSFIRYFD